jgi:hypothetical protein
MNQYSDSLLLKTINIMKNYSKAFLSIGLCLLFSCSFSQQSPDTAKANKEALATLNDYFVALKENDISKAINFYANTKDFLVLANGKAMSYEEFTTSARTTSSQIKKLLLRYDKIYVRNIDESAVMITGPFHQSVIDTNDRQFDFDGTASVILLKRGGQWKITYVTQVVQPVSD